MSFKAYIQLSMLTPWALLKLVGKFLLQAFTNHFFQNVRKNAKRNNPTKIVFLFSFTGNFLSFQVYWRYSSAFATHSASDKGWCWKIKIYSYLMYNTCYNTYLHGLNDSIWIMTFVPLLAQIVDIFTWLWPLWPTCYSQCKGQKQMNTLIYHL